MSFIDKAKSTALDLVNKGQEIATKVLAPKDGKKVERFSDTSMFGGSFFHLVLMFVAFIVAFRCNHNKMDFISFLGACCCPYIYIPYKLTTAFDICMNPLQKLKDLDYDD